MAKRKKAAKKRPKKKVTRRPKKKIVRKPKKKAVRKSKKKAVRKPKKIARRPKCKVPSWVERGYMSERPKSKIGTSKKRNVKKRRKPIIERVSPAVGGGKVLETVYYRKGKFRKDAMIDLSTGKRSTFVSTKPRPDVWLIIGCLPKDYDPKRGVCLRTTVHKKIRKISEAEARRLKAANPQLLIISNPCPEARVLMRKRPNSKPSRRKPNACKKVARPRTVRLKVKPSIMKVKPRKNLTVTPNDVGRARRAFKRFHFVAPAKVTSGNVPNGYEDAYMVIGELERFDVKTPSGKIVSRRYRANRPRLCTTANMKDIFVFAGSKLGIPAGNAMRCDYRVPAHSGRNKWSNRWWHPHDTHPKVLPHRGGCAVRVTGSGLKVTPRGIEG